MIEVKGGYLVRRDENSYLALPMRLITGVRLLPKGVEHKGETLSAPMAQVYLGETQEQWWDFYGPDASDLPRAWEAYLTQREEEYRRVAELARRAQ